jgi:hypothetical protein
MGEAEREGGGRVCGQTLILDPLGPLTLGVAVNPPCREVCSTPPTQIGRARFSPLKPPLYLFFFVVLSPVKLYHLIFLFLLPQSLLRNRL